MLIKRVENSRTLELPHQTYVLTQLKCPLWTVHRVPLDIGETNLLDLGRGVLSTFIRGTCYCLTNHSLILVETGVATRIEGYLKDRM